VFDEPKQEISSVVAKKGATNKIDALTKGGEFVTLRDRQAREFMSLRTR